MKKKIIVLTKNFIGQSLWNKKTFNFEKFSNYLSAIEKNCKKVFIKSKDSKVCWRSWGKGTAFNTSSWWLWKLGTLDKTSNTIFKKL